MHGIAFDGIEKSYGAARVLEPLSRELEDGEFTVLVGPSGCRKSTTLRMLARLDTLSGGEIFFDGKPIRKRKPKERDMATVFQDYALYPQMNIARNMSFARRLARVNKAEMDTRAIRVAEMPNIGQLLDRRPTQLSGDQRQRVAMGRAMVRDSGTFLFDEPLPTSTPSCAPGHAPTWQKCATRSTRTCSTSTHDQVEAMTLGDGIVEMSDGCIQQEGTPEQLSKTPVNRFVAGFSGGPAMKFVDATLAAEDGRPMVKGDGFALPLPPGALTEAPEGKPVHVGIRPSSFSMNTDGPAMKPNVSVAEYPGAQTVLVTRCGGQELLDAVNSAQPVRPGSTVSFGVKIDALMRFDPATGLRISHL